MKKLLIITYYWIPSGGAGVQRWVKFVKYLREFGWEPIVYTPENPEYPSTDFSFQKDIPGDVTILKTPIWEPYNVYRSLLGKKGQTINAGFINESKKSGWKDKLSVAIRGNFLIPDPRKFWVKPSVRFLKKYIAGNKVDAVVSTGPPHSMHLIAKGLKKHFPSLPWIADFRDPWTNIDFYKELQLTKLADYQHHRLEKQVVQSCDALVVVSGSMQQEFSLLKPAKSIVIPNGYDETDVVGQDIPLDERFSISHIGTMNASRNPDVIWRALSNLVNRNTSLKRDLIIQLIGKVDFSVTESITQYGLQDNLLKIDYLPHAEAILKQQSSQLLLLIINRSANAKGILTGKFFEYLASGRPILGVGPSDGDAADILNRCEAGKMVDFEDVESAEKYLAACYQLYQEKKLKNEIKSVEQYSRKHLTSQLAALLNQLTAHA
jgi:hypothetical protein